MAAQFASITLTEIRHYQQAKQLVQEYVPKDRQASILVIIAGGQSFNGDLEQAIATVDALSESGAREMGLALVATRQAQRGDVGEAESLMRGITEPSRLDMVRESIAEAQAQAGDLSAARITAAKIGDDYYRQSAEDAIAQAESGKDPPLGAVDSPFIRSALEAMLLFGKAGAWRNHALNAIVAAKRKNVEELDGWIRRTLAAVEQENAPAPATARLLLCVALAMADRPDEAAAMARRFLVAADGEIVGISGLFGRPVLAYLFTRLKMEEELRKVLEADPEDFANPGILQAVGAAEAEAGNWPSLEVRYRKLSAPLDRVNLSCGVLMGMQDSGNGTQQPVSLEGAAR